MAHYPQFAVAVARPLPVRGVLRPAGSRQQESERLIEGPLLAIGWDQPDVSSIGRTGLWYLVLSAERGGPVWLYDDEVSEIALEPFGSGVDARR